MSSGPHIHRFYTINSTRHSTVLSAPFYLARKPLSASFPFLRNGRRLSIMTKSSPDETISEFKNCVNMTPKELQDFLQSKESNEVGWSKDGGESVGHQSGRRIVELLQKSNSDYDDDDISHMRKVVGYVHRHSAQGPSKNDVEHSKWRYSLMNWGNDPLKE